MTDVPFTELNPGNGGDKILNDALVNLNGAPATPSGVEMQRSKVGFGGPGDFNDVTAATPLPVAPNVTRGAGYADANTQRVTLAADGPAVTALTAIDADLGSPSDAAAATDTGTAGIIPLIKRGLTNWTTLLARIPALVSGRVPVDGSGVTQPVSGTVTANLGTLNGAATAANQTTSNTTLANIDSDLGAPADAAYAGAGSASVIAALKGLYSLLAAPLPAGSNAIGTVTANAGTGTFAVSAAALPLPSGASTETTLAAMSLKLPTALGQTLMANSLSVTLASDQGPINVRTDNVVDGLVTSASVTSATTVISLTMAGYQGGSFHVTNAGTTCTVTYEESNDGTNWTALFVYNRGAANGAPVSASTTTGIFTFQSTAAFVRARVSTYTSGTVAISAVQKRLSPQLVGIALAGGSANIGTVNIAASQTLALVSVANLGIPVLFTDVASAALTTTTTTATITPSNGLSYEVNIPVTVVSGTSPTLDVVVQESDDTGTNWFDVYHFPRITATGMYRSPKLPATGNRVRYVQTVGGTTPSFTRAINRLQSNDPAPPLRKIFDRSLASTQASNSTTASMVVLGAMRNLQLVIAAGAINTTAPALQLQGSDDGGVTWYAIGTPLTAVASSTVQQTVTNVYAELVRAIVTTAGSGATLTYVALKAF